MKVYKISEGKYMMTDGEIVREVNEEVAQHAMRANEASKKEDEKQPSQSNPYFFSTILFFTNERNPEKNKTLKNLQEAVEGTSVDIQTFVAEEVSYKATDKKISISDFKNKYVVDKQSNIDTIVIARLGIQDSEECMACVKELQDWGLFVLNPVQAAQKACNKYESAVLMERYGVPQPKFALIDKSDISEGQDSLSKKLKTIYKEAGNEDGHKDREYVVKILDGHGGTGVWMTNEKDMLAILQTIFAIDEDRQLLVQKKEEADGGDIRVHVLTTRAGQRVLAAMKRVKISGDFRSNVSLGASAEKVSITDEQEEIAKNVAKISGMPWCAVDIMPLKKGSNPEIGDNVVLEYNASPGTDGISEVIGENFCNVLLNAINDINELVLQPKSIGYKEDIEITLDDDTTLTFEAKLDTGNGAKASTIGCDEVIVDGEDVAAKIRGKEYKFKKQGLSVAKVGPVTEERTTVVIPKIKLGTRQLLNVEFALVDNRDKSTNVLLNRDVMSKLAYLINPSKKHTLDDK